MPTEQTNIVPGAVLEGKVQGITNFGAFIELPGGVVGLVHISEIANTYVKNVKDFIQEGETVKVKILNVAGKKVGLSIKQAIPPRPVQPRDSGTSDRNVSSGERHQHVPSHRHSHGGGHMSLDDKIAKFLKESDERMQPLKNKIEPRRRRNNQ